MRLLNLGRLVALVAVAALMGCGTQLKVAPVDAKTGLLKSEIGEIGQAHVVTAKQLSLAQFNGIALTTGGGEYGVDQLKATGLFPQVHSFETMQKLIVANGLQDQVTSISEPVGLTRLAKAYKPFLWVHLKLVRKERDPYFQLIATDPRTLDELFVAEVKLDLIWKGVNDQTARYPLYNAFITWAHKNP